MDMGENYCYLLILTQWGGTRLMIAWTGQEPGGINLDQTLEPVRRTCLFHLTVKESRSETGEKTKEGSELWNKES